jgi:hypothetical protein
VKTASTPSQIFLRPVIVELLPYFSLIADETRNAWKPMPVHSRCPVRKVLTEGGRSSIALKGITAE